MADYDKHIVCMTVIAPCQSKSGFTFGEFILLHNHFWLSQSKTSINSQKQEWDKHCPTLICFISTFRYLGVSACRPSSSSNKVFTHYTQKFSYLPYTLQHPFTIATVSYMSNNFLTELCKKYLCSFLCSVCGPLLVSLLL